MIGHDFVDVEEEAVHQVFDERPEEEAYEPV